MSIQLRPYQIDVLNKTKTVLETKKEVVIAASPSSGKTIMALKFIQETPGTFLIITHGQNILKDMWDKEISTHLSEKDKKRVIFGLPQSLTRKEIPVVDYVVVDEAHEFTFSDMVQKILAKNLKAKKLFLTGTPSKFIEKGYEVIVIPAVDLIKQGYISDLYVGVFSTKADIRGRNSEANLNEKSSKNLEKTVENDLNSLLKSLIERLKMVNALKKAPLAARFSGWSSAIGALGKTMIACNSIVQASKVESYFKQQGISVLMSNSVNDPETENIKKFETDPNVKVLVVVDRAILGFNFPDLANVVDMTGSHNINRIYQLYARVMRKNDKVPNKYFFKLAEESQMLVTKFYMNAALCMLYEYFISNFNGKNLNKLKVPAFIEKRKERSTKVKKNLVSNGKKTIPKELFEAVTAANILNDIFNKVDSNLNEYAMVTFGEIREKVFKDGFSRPIINITEENLLFMIENGVVDERIYG